MADFQADEDVPLEIVLGLRALGHDALTALGAGIANVARSDAEALASARAVGRVFITMNRDHFRRLHRSGAAHAGIVLVSRTDIRNAPSFIDAIASSRSTLTGRLYLVRADGFDDETEVLRNRT